ncbi:MAG: nitroreductase family protein [Clostridia bacterium]|nr:nitroreductase family protein [Clostridia bacterium]
MKKILCIAFILVFALSACAVAEKADVLYNRTTIHGNGKYDTEPLSQETIDLLLNAAFSAPSGGNQQSNNYYVVTDREIMKVIQEGHPYSQPLDTAPLVIIVAGDESTCRYPELLEMDAGLSAGAMQVQATALGLSSCVMSIYPQEERVDAVRKAVNMPETMKPVLMVAFGTADVDTVASASVENYSADRVFVNGAE